MSKEKEMVGNINIPMELSFDPDRKKNFLHMRFADCCMMIGKGEGEDREEIGSIEGCIGGGLEIHDKETGRTYFLSPIDIWNSFCEFTDKPERKIVQEKTKKKNE